MLSQKEAKYCGTNLLTEQVDAWERLAARAGMNRNKFLRFLLTHLTEADIDSLLARR